MLSFSPLYSVQMWESVTWNNVGTQSEKKALSFFKSVKLSDSDIASDGERIRNQLLGCYENFSSSEVIQAKVFELLASTVIKSKSPLFTDDSLVLTLHYAKNMMSEWISSSEIIANVLKFLSVLYEKEKPGSVDEELIAQCGDVLKHHCNCSSVQKMCLTFLCGALRYCEIESFSEHSVVAIGDPIVGTIKSCNNDIDIVIKSLVVLSSLFERVPQHLQSVCVDALDVVNSFLQHNSSNFALASMAVDFLQLCAVEDTHLIILSSSDQGFGLYCDLCEKFMENHDIKSSLSCVRLIKRACREKIMELTINSIPRLKKKIIRVVGQVRDDAAASSIEGSISDESFLGELVSECDGAMGALDLSYRPNVSSDTIPRRPSADSGYAPPKPPAPELPISTVRAESLLESVSSVRSSDKIKAKRRSKARGNKNPDSGQLGGGSEHSVTSTSSCYSSSPAQAILRNDSIDSDRKKASIELLKGSTSLDDVESTAVDDVSDVPSHGGTESTIPALDLRETDVATNPSQFDHKVPTVPTKDPLLEKLRSFQDVISATSTPRSEESVPLSARNFRQSKSMDLTMNREDHADEVAILRQQLEEEKNKMKEVEENLREEEQKLFDVMRERDELQEAFDNLAQSANRSREVEEVNKRAAVQELQKVEEERNSLISEVKLLHSRIEDASVAAKNELQNVSNLQADNLSLSTEIISLRASVENQNLSDQQSTVVANKKVESLSSEVSSLVEERSTLRSQVSDLESALNESLQNAIADKRAFEEELTGLKTSLSKQSELEREIASLRNEREGFIFQLEEVHSKFAAREQSTAVEAEAASEIERLTLECTNYSNEILLLKSKLDDVIKDRNKMEDENRKAHQLGSISKKSQEQAAFAVHRVEELHAVLVEATEKIETLMADNAKLKTELQDALKREEALVHEQEELIAAYRENDEDEESNHTVILVGDDDSRIVVTVGDTKMDGREIDYMGTVDKTAADSDTHEVDESGENENDDETFYHNQSIRVPKKTPSQSAAAGIQSALNFLKTLPAEQNSGDDSDIDALIEVTQVYRNIIFMLPLIFDVGSC